MRTHRHRQQLNSSTFIRALSLVSFPRTWPRDGEGDPPPPPAATIDPNDPVIKKIVEDATKGLRDNRDKAIQQLKDQQAKLDQLGGDEGLQKLIQLNEAVAKSEELQLLKDGKINEVYERRVKPERDKFATELKARDDALTAAQEVAAKAQSKLNSYVFKAEVSEACKAVDLLPVAYADAERAAKEIFVFDEELQRHVMKDSTGQTVFGLDDKGKPAPKTLAQWLSDDQKKVTRHWWAASKGSGIKGESGVPGSTDTSLSSVAKDPKAYAAARAEGAGGGIPRG